MSSRWYPLYQKGNPQLRVFLPNFWMKMVKPKHKQPTNIVQFHVSMRMTKHDIRSYLEKLYGIQIIEVRTEIASGAFKKQELRGYVVKEDDYKVAYVTLPREESFEFPNLFPKDKKAEIEKEMKSLEEAKKSYRKLEERNVYRPGLPGWFTI